MGGTRLDLGHDVELHRGRLVWFRPKGDVLVYEGAELVGWHGEAHDRGMFSGRAARRVPGLWAFWRAAVGWDADAVDQAGAYKLVAVGTHRTALIGPAQRGASVSIPWDDTPNAPPLRNLDGLDPSSLSGGASLHHSPHGVVLCEPEFGLVWSLDEGRMWQLSGVDSSHGMSAFRTDGGVWVHSSWTERQGPVGWISDMGEARSVERVQGSAAPFVAVGASAWTFLCRGLRSDVDVCRLAPDGSGLERKTPLSDGVDAVAVGEGRAVVVLTSGTAIRFDVSDEAWVEREVLHVPSGSLDRFNAPAALGESAAQWSGPPGAIEVPIGWRNTGGGAVGLRIRVACTGGVVIDAVRIGEQRVTLEDGMAAFGQLHLAARGPLDVVLSGEAAGPGSLRVDVVGWKRASAGLVRSERDPVHLEEVILGTGTVEISVESSLVAVRGDARLSLDAAWTSQLVAGGAVDGEAREPDLDRWMYRALRRCRVQSAEEAPEAVRETWLRMSSAERAAHTGRLPLYKLQSGRDWIVTEEECAAIREALTAEHPLARFSAAGSFVIVSGE